MFAHVKVEGDSIWLCIIIIMLGSMGFGDFESEQELGHAIGLHYVHGQRLLSIYEQPDSALEAIYDNGDRPSIAE